MFYGSFEFIGTNQSCTFYLHYSEIVWRWSFYRVYVFKILNYTLKVTLSYNCSLLGSLIWNIWAKELITLEMYLSLISMHHLTSQWIASISRAHTQDAVSPTSFSSVLCSLGSNEECLSERSFIRLRLALLSCSVQMNIWDEFLEKWLAPNLSHLQK